MAGGNVVHDIVSVIAKWLHVVRKTAVAMLDQCRQQGGEERRGTSASLGTSNEGGMVAPTSFSFKIYHAIQY